MALPQQFSGFRFAFLLGGPKDAVPSMGRYTYKDDEKLSFGDLVNLESGEIDLAATDDSALLGMVLATQTGTDSVTEAWVIDDPDAVYAAWDTTSRDPGASLDISGTTGAQALAANSNSDVRVIRKQGTNITLFIITPAEHAYARS